MNSFHDLSSGKILSIEELYFKAFTKALVRLKIIQSAGFNISKESVKEVCLENAKKDKERFEFKDATEHLSDLERVNSAFKNEMFFEDDVMAYLLTLPQNIGKSYSSFVGKVESRIIFDTNLEGKTRKDKISRLSNRGNSFLIGMASGEIDYREERVEDSKDCYNRASYLREECFGRGDSLAMVQRKLGKRFNRYFSILGETFEILYQLKTS